MEKGRFSLVLHNSSLMENLKRNNVPFKKIHGMCVSIRIIREETNEKMIWEYITNETLKNMNKTFDELYNVAFKEDLKHGYEMIDIMDAIGNNPMLSKKKANKYKKLERHQKVFILTNPEKVNGATAILHESFMEKVFNELGDSVFIVPVNTHYVYCLSTDVSAKIQDKYQLLLNNPLKQDKELKTELIRIDRRKV